MKRRLYLTFVFASLSLLAVVVGLFARSCVVCDGFVRIAGGNLTEVRVARGRVGILRVYGAAKPDARGTERVRWAFLTIPEFWTAPGAFTARVPAGWRFGGFEYRAGQQTYAYKDSPTDPHSFDFLDRQDRRIVVPYWPVAVAAAWPLWLFVLRFGRRRLSAVLVGRRAAKAGRCSACGYDLRASPDRCPECGLPAVVRSG